MAAVVSPDNWWPGDRMLCVRQDARQELVIGRIYLLKSRNPDGQIEVARFCMAAPPNGRCFPPSLFRWIRPHISDPQDGWTIALMNGGQVDGDALADEPSWWKSPHMTEFRKAFRDLEISGG